MRPAADRFDQMLTAAERDQHVKAIVIDVDTPGGAVTPSDEIYARIQRFKRQNPKRPVVVTMGGMATSGGYYIAVRGDYVFAQPTTLTGNIGVILPRYNFSKLAKSYGVEEVTVTAPAHGFKNAGSPMAPISPDDDKYYQGLIDAAYGNFKTAVPDRAAGEAQPEVQDRRDRQRQGVHGRGGEGPGAGGRREVRQRRVRQGGEPGGSDEQARGQVFQAAGAARDVRRGGSRRAAWAVAGMLRSSRTALGG